MILVLVYTVLDVMGRLGWQPDLLVCELLWDYGRDLDTVPRLHLALTTAQSLTPNDVIGVYCTVCQQPYLGIFGTVTVNKKFVVQLYYGTWLKLNNKTTITFLFFLI